MAAKNFLYRFTAAAKQTNKCTFNYLSVNSKPPIANNMTLCSNVQRWKCYLSQGAAVAAAVTG